MVPSFVTESLRYAVGRRVHGPDGVEAACAFVVARTCTWTWTGCVSFDCAVFCCRGLVQVEGSDTEMAAQGTKRPAGEAEDRAIQRFLVELPEAFPCAGAREAEA